MSKAEGGDAATDGKKYSVSAIKGLTSSRVGYIRHQQEGDAQPQSRI